MKSKTVWLSEVWCEEDAVLRPDPLRTFLKEGSENSKNFCKKEILGAA